MSIVDDRDDDSILLPPEMPPPAMEQRPTTTFRSPKEALNDLVHKVDTTDLRHAMKNEIKRLMNDHERLVCMLQQRSELLENENGQLKMATLESQKRYEKAVREMQFFRRKCEMQKRPRSLSIESGSSSEAAAASNKNKFPLTPTSPQNSTSILDKNSRSSSQSTSTSADHQRMFAEQQEQHPPPPPPPPQTPPPAVPHQLNTSTTTTTLASTASSAHTVSSNNTNASSSSNSSTSNNKSNTTPVAVPPPSRSTTTASTTTTSSLIQQRRVDPLIFGGSDALWETIAKSKGSDVTVEKIIGNFLRRGGSPNTAQQSPTAHAVMYGYGMIHALIVTKAPGSLDLLLEQGANPNVMTLSQNEDDKVECD